MGDVPQESASSRRISTARVFECYSPPPTNSFKGTVVPRALSRRRRRKIAIEIHESPDGFEECIVRVMDPASEVERRVARKRLKTQEALIDDDSSLSSTASMLPVEFRDTHSSYYAGWVAKYKFPVRTLTLKGTHKSSVFVQVDLGKRKQIRELIFDSVSEGETFQALIKEELAKESSRAKAKVAAVIGSDELVNDDKKVAFLFEIVSGWDIPVGDTKTSDPFVVCKLNNREVHRTKYISRTLDPIWTLKTHSLFLLRVSIPDLFASEGLVCVLYDYDNVSKNEKLGMITVPPKVIYEATGERLEFKLKPPKRKNVDQVPGWLAIRCRKASDADIDFIEEYYSSSGDKARQGLLGGKARSVALHALAEANRGSGNIKSFITRKVRVAKDGSNEYKVRPYPDPNRADDTVWLTAEEIETESQLPSSSWVDTGSGSLGRIFLEILGCDGLPNLDAGGFAGNKTDAFVSIVYEDAVVRTDVIDDCLSPRWMPWCQRAFIFHMLHSSSQIFLGIFDYDQGINPADDHDLIGRVSVDLSNLRRDTTYTLKYNIFPTAKLSNRRKQGTITLRLRLEVDDERRLLLSTLEPPPAVYVNAKTRRDFRLLRYTVSGKYDMDKYNMKTINAYVEELLSLQHALFYVQDGLLSLLLWRNTFELPVGAGNSMMVPLHSFSAFVAAIVLVENPVLIPSFCFASLGWIMLGVNGFRKTLPDVWSRCKTFRELFGVLMFGASSAPPDSIEANENQEEAAMYVEYWKKRIKRSDEDAERAYKASLTRQADYQEEMEEYGDNDTDISTRRDGVSVDPFKPILFPLQQNLALICGYVRHVKHVVSWEECYISFWVSLACFLLAFGCFFVPWFSLIQWSSRAVVWALFGPWMKLVDILYVRRLKPRSVADLDRTAEVQRLQRMNAKAAMSSYRVKRENAEKTKAMKKYLFGKFIVRVPVLKNDRYRDLPLADSYAVPYRPDPRPLAELAMEDAGYRRTRIPGQHLEGDMIPRVVPGSFTDAPTGQATAHPNLLVSHGASADSIEEAFMTMASVVLAAAVLTALGVPHIRAGMEHVVHLIHQS